MSALCGGLTRAFGDLVPEWLPTTFARREMTPVRNKNRLLLALILAAAADAVEYEDGVAVLNERNFDEVRIRICLSLEREEPC